MSTTGLAIVENLGRLEIRILTDLTIMNAAAVRTAVLRAWEDAGKPQVLVLDLAGARHIDSSGVGALLEIAHRVEGAGVRLALTGLNASVQRMFDRMGMGMLFHISGPAAGAVRDSSHW